MSKEMKISAIGLIHEHGQITEQIKHEPYGDAGDHVTTDAIDELEERLGTIESILENYFEIDLLRDLKDN